jgi:hypothetical protein
MTLLQLAKKMKPASGRDLDRLGDLYGVRRWRFWIFAWPLDPWFRRRVRAQLRRLETR